MRRRRRFERDDGLRAHGRAAPRRSSRPPPTTICTTSNDVKIDAQPPDFGTDGPQADEIKATAPFWAATADQQQQLLEQLSQLQPPADLQQKYDEFLRLQKKANVELALTLQKYAEAADVKAFFQ